MKVEELQINFNVPLLPQDVTAFPAVGNEVTSVKSATLPEESTWVKTDNPKTDMD